MKTIHYITANKEKFRSASLILKEFDIEVIQATIETPEVQADSAVEVSRYSAEYGSKQLGTPVIKMDVEFIIEVFQSFPGPYIKYFNKNVPPEKVLKMVQGETNRGAHFNDVICFFNAKKMISKCFEFRTNGTIGDKVVGKNGWGIDRVFIPDGYRQTLAEMSDEERLGVWKNNLWSDLAKYLLQTL